jgi:AraC family transcriptional regulator
MSHCTCIQPEHSMGQLFCSQAEGKNSDRLSSGVSLTLNKKTAHEKWHSTRLSLRCVFNAEQVYETTERKIHLLPGNFLLLNEGQQHRSHIAGGKPATLCFAFQTDLPGQVADCVQGNYRHLLDDPFRPGKAVYFFEQLYSDPFILQTLYSLKQLLEKKQSLSDLALEELAITLLEKMIAEQFLLEHRLHRIPMIKRGTKIELFKRLTIAREYMDAYYETDLSLKKIASVAYLSLAALKKSFHAYYQVTPHQYLIQKRLEKALHLLKVNEGPLLHIAQKSGFTDVSSFIRCFKKTYQCTPRNFSLKK